MIKLLIGGSPCTHWSIAKVKGREIAPKGEGWELFKNFWIAREKYKPDYFLYENNKSMNRRRNSAFPGRASRGINGKGICRLGR